MSEAEMETKDLVNKIKEIDDSKLDTIFVSTDNTELNISSLLKTLASYEELLEKNDGSNIWDMLLRGFVSKIDGVMLSKSLKNSFKEDEVIILSYLYIFFGEVIEISEYDIRLLKNYKKLEGFIKNKNNSFHSEEKEVDLAYKYDRDYKRSLFRYRVAKESKNLIENEVERSFEKYVEEKHRLESEVEDLRATLGSIRQESSFYVNISGFNRLGASLKNKYRMNLAVLFIIPVLMFCYLYFAWGEFSDLSNLESSGRVVYEQSEGDEVDAANGFFWESLTIKDFKLFVFSSTVIFLSLYFFRVFLASFNRVGRNLEKVEQKAAMSAFIVGHADKVIEREGDINSTFERYEKFIFNDTGERDDFMPEPMDNYKELTDCFERIIKASKK